jgi:ankyrin repeat protein
MRAAAAKPAAGAGNAAIVDAVKRQDKTGTRALIKQRADVNAVDAEGMTALHWAAHWDDLDTVKVLLRAGARAKVANRYGVTPLHEACTVGIAMIEALLDGGADRTPCSARAR